MSSKKYIEQGHGLPNWSNPSNHAVVVNNMCFVSGQLSIDLEGNYIPGTIEEETARAFSNFLAAIKNEVFTKQDVVFIDIAFDDLKELPKVNRFYTALFPEGKRPARTIYQAEALPFEGKIKITGTAVKDINF